jgi:hypothetical protein
MAKGLEEAKAAFAKAKDKYAMYLNCQCEPAPVFTRDKVWLIAVSKTLGTAATMQFFVHMPAPKVFGLFLDTSSMDPLEPSAKSYLFHHLQVCVT